MTKRDQSRLSSRATPTPREERASVLVVDDDVKNLLALEEALAPLGHPLVRATSGTEALKLVLRHDFALILLDVNLGTMNGYETAALLKQHVRSRHIPIIFISGVSNEEAHVFRGYSEGAVDYLRKPVDPDILRSKARVFLELHLKNETIKQQERLLRERERASLERKLEVRYRGLIDAMPMAVCAARPDGTFYYWNHAFLSYCGFDPREIDNDSFWAAFHADDRAEAQRTWREAVSRAEPFEGQFRLRRGADGSHRWHLARAVAERDEAGEIVGWIATATDIDDQKRAESELQKALQLRDEFLSVASHELRTPMTTAKLTLEALTRTASRAGDSIATSSLAPKITRLGSGLDRLNRLIDLLLDVSRISGGRLGLEREAFDLTTLAQEVCDRFGDDKPKHRERLRISATGDTTGRWDRARLDQLVTNLVSNALKYGSDKPVDVILIGDSERLRLTVSDQGIGIDGADHQRIFERFERSSNAAHITGIGLGLWIVSEIAQAHGGRVWLESALGAGSRFHVELPRDAPAAVTVPLATGESAAAVPGELVH